MSQSVFEEALQKIEQRRIRAEHENDRRHEEVSRTIPQIAEVNHHLRQTASKFFETLQAGTDVQTRIEALRRQNEEAQALSTQLLVANGYPADYLDMHYTCPHCSDTGYQGSHYCDCVHKMVASVGIARMNQNAQLKLSNFDTFSLEYYRGRTTEQGEDCFRMMQSIYNYCRKYAENFSPESPSLLFYGRTGLGKTHLSLAIVTVALEKGYEVIYDSIINLLQKVEREHFGREKSEVDTLELLLNTELLVLDDLGTEFDTPFHTSTIYNIINTRINRGMPTIINTNLDYAAIRRRYEERIVSRLFAVYECLHFVGSDIRLIKKRENAPIL